MGYHPRMSKSVTRGSWRWRQRGAGGTHRGPSALRPLSSQRCLVRVAFRPVLPIELIHQEALQALTKEAEAKSVHGGVREGEPGAGDGGAAHCTPGRCTKAWEQTPPALRLGGRGVRSPGQTFLQPCVCGTVSRG